MASFFSKSSESSSKASVSSNSKTYLFGESMSG